MGAKAHEIARPRKAHLTCSQEEVPVMEIPTKQDLIDLMNEREGPHVSLYMPAHTRGPETQQNPIMLKNLRTAAEHGLIEAGMRPTLATEMLAPVESLEGDFDFWQHQNGGLAIFLNGGGLRSFRVPMSLPEMAVVEPRFHLKPLLPLLSEGYRFHVLAISSNHTRVLACTPHTQSEVRVDGLPRGIADVLWPEDPEKQQQFHSFYAGASGDTSIQHGAGGSEPDTKDELLRYFQGVDRVLTPYMHEKGGPLVLACVDYVAPIFREANSYQLLVTSPLSGSPDRAQDEDLRAQAWELLEPEVEAQRTDALGRYRQLAGTGQTSNDVAEAVLAALTGKVDTVFVTLDRQQWGRVDLDAYRADLHEEKVNGDYDLLDAIAAHTLANGGTVYAVEEGDALEPSGVAAVFRYA
jgi:hypothetical protein